jgi:hypothetical protein
LGDDLRIWHAPGFTVGPERVQPSPDGYRPGIAPGPVIEINRRSRC